MKIEGEVCGVIEVKRFTIDGVNIRDLCPKCGKETAYFTDYFSYPVPGEVLDVDFCCSDCEEYWTDSIKIRVLVEPVYEKRAQPNG